MIDVFQYYIANMGVSVGELLQNSIHHAFITGLAHQRQD